MNGRGGQPRRKVTWRRSGELNKFVSFRLPEHMLDVLRSEAEEYESVSAFIRTLVVDGLKRRERQRRRGRLRRAGRGE